MKTCMEWLETLPEPYRSQAIENCKREDEQSEYGYTGNRPAEDMYTALIRSFLFEETPEGEDYWFLLCDKYFVPE